MCIDIHTHTHLLQTVMFATTLVILFKLLLLFPFVTIPILLRMYIHTIVEWLGTVCVCFQSCHVS